MTSFCPSCGNRAVKASGSLSSKVLLIGEFPGINEMDTGRPFTGPAGGVLRKELSKLGVDLLQFRVTNLYIHEPIKTTKKEPDKGKNCFQAGLDACLEEAKGKQAILLVGSEAVEFFTGYKVSDVNGLQVESPMLSSPIIYASVNPAAVFHRSLGELRFALVQFVQHIQRDGLI
jgi:DNA polymerase